MCVCVCVCVCVCMCVWVGACVRVCVRACVREKFNFDATYQVLYELRTIGPELTDYSENINLLISFHFLPNATNCAENTTTAASIP